MPFVTEQSQAFTEEQSSSFTSEQATTFCEDRTSRTDINAVRGWGRQPWGTSTWGVGEAELVTFQLDGFTEETATQFTEES